jgi:hypothetical protein
VALADETRALTGDHERYQPAGTVSGQATLVVRVEDPSARPVLRLTRFLPEVTLLRFRDLAPDGSALGPEQEAVTVAGPGPRQVDHPVDPAPGTATREYRLEWVLDPQAHPSIGVVGAEMLLFRAHLLTHDPDGAEQVRDQWLFPLVWLSEEDLLDMRSQSVPRPEPLSLALRALLSSQEENPPRCEVCRQQFDLVRLEHWDAVWEHSAGPEQEPLRRLLVLRALAGPLPADSILRHRLGHEKQHADVTEQLAAARERHQARLRAWS